MRSNFATVEEYFAALPEAARGPLQTLRDYLKTLLPGAVEKISYQIPTLVQGNVPVHYAGYAKHIGFYPGAAVLEAFAAELQGYKTSRGTVQFPLGRPLPLDLIRRMTLNVLEHRR